MTVKKKKVSLLFGFCILPICFPTSPLKGLISLLGGFAGVGGTGGTRGSQLTEEASSFPSHPKRFRAFESVRRCRGARACGGLCWRLSYRAVVQRPRLSGPRGEAPSQIWPNGSCCLPSAYCIHRGCSWLCVCVGSWITPGPREVTRSHPCRVS